MRRNMGASFDCGLGPNRRRRGIVPLLETFDGRAGNKRQAERSATACEDAGRAYRWPTPLGSQDPMTPSTTPDVAIVGSGPTGIYTLAGLLASARPLAVTMFESQAEAGWGSPYAPGMNDRALLANIASIEIPPVTETLAAWLDRQDDAELARMGVTRERVTDREFFPRLVLGEYFRAQLAALIARAEAGGWTVEVRTGHEVVDLAPAPQGVRLEIADPEGTALHFAASHVVIATGHAWPDATETSPGYFSSPYPSSALRAVPPVHVGIRGASLSAIDALVTIATTHGAFLLDAEGVLQYHARIGAEGFRASLLSRKGLLPEADFHFPIPYEPNRVLTDEAVDALIASGRRDLLDAAFDLFRAELLAADPDYAATVGLAGLDADSFAAAYFGQRDDRDALTWAALNLAEAKANYARGHTVPWRYAILRSHEAVERIVPYLTPEDLDRFRAGLKDVFVDDYATVPHESIERLLALRRARRLEVLRLGEDYEVEPATGGTGAVLTYPGGTVRFAAFVEGTGQRPQAVPDIPFPSLLSMGAVRRARAGSMASLRPGAQVRSAAVPETGPETDGIDLDEAFRPRSEAGLVHELYCLSLPFLLHRMPFSQGITSAHDIAGIAAVAILAAGRQEGRGRTAA